MAGLPRPASAIPSKKTSMRPPTTTRPSHSRSATALGHRGTHSGAASPANSESSAVTTASRAKSPGATNAGTKRKQRDYEQDGGEETNINVVVRCRGRNEREVRENSGVVLSTDGTRGKTVELSMGPSALSNKTYRFDKVFSPAADQAMIYDEVVTPILDEMLSGYNCTIFAYGQTGTGKTYTMSGDMSDTLGLISDSAGIIPRVLHSLFNKLEADGVESSVKCSFIELYNEELRDLVSAEENTKLKIYEDTSRKGHTATLVQGMEESHIKDAVDGIKLLQAGSFKRQVAATKCNDLSSRSHTVFTVTAYIKRTVDGSEDFVSAGKLNLVDLAGSENIQRSGAENKRAAEAGLINKSLLTLGRVINALVDRSSHIPYRESKLTRLLQDSLGGRTKTCIIATVSPAKSNLEETISTLDYAFRAKNIRNKPQVNQMISKNTLLREFTQEIEKLKSELVATRQRNGVYLSADAYEEITVESESRRILSEEQKAKIETMEANLRNKVQELFSLTQNFQIQKKNYESAKATLDKTEGILGQTEFVLANTKRNLAEETLLRKAHQQTEEELVNVGGELLSTLGHTVTDVGGLHSKLRRRSDLQSLNRNNWKASQAQVSDVTRLVEMRVKDFRGEQERMMQKISARMQGFLQEELEKLEASQNLLSSKVEAFEASEKVVSQQSSLARDEMNEILEEIKTLREEVKTRVGEGLNGLSATAARISAEVINELQGFHSQVHTSYSSLGRDFKNIFEDLVKHLNSQKTEANELQQQLHLAGASAMQANDQANERLNEVLREERQQAASDRQNLLTQISSLINYSGQEQEERLNSKIKLVQADINAMKANFQSAEGRYGEGMTAWNNKEVSLVDEVLKQREAIKAKLKKDWMDANEHNTSIQTTTKSVHAETVRIVEEQMKDMSKQMQALDAFVTRARSQNGAHHDTHSTSLCGLASTVRQSYDDIGTHFKMSYQRIGTIESDVTSQATAIQSTLSILDDEVVQPLIDLRSRVVSMPLKEYAPTGETPAKVQYQYPTILPRTEAHDSLLSVLRQPAGSSVSTAPQSSPSRATHAVFNDVDDSVAMIEHVEPGLMEKPASSGLREMDANINGGSPRKATSDVVVFNIENPPPLKRQNTSGDGKRPKSAGKSVLVKLEGRENSIPLFRGSTGRRLRSSPPQVMQE